MSGAGLAAIEAEMARQAADAVMSVGTAGARAAEIAALLRKMPRLLLLGMGASLPTFKLLLDDAKNGYPMMVELLRLNTLEEERDNFYSAVVDFYQKILTSRKPAAPPQPPPLDPTATAG